MIRWQKHGLIYSCASHAQVPTPDPIDADTLRIYFGTRDEKNRTHTVFIDVDAQQPTSIRKVHQTPVMPLGNLGCFDDSGVMPSCVVADGPTRRIYYTGWNTSTTVPYRNSIGVAIGDGLTFTRPHEGPILDRTHTEPHFCATPFVLRENIWRMWYLSCSDWTLIDGRPEARYLIRYAESSDGFDWQKRGAIAIDYKHPQEAIARPWVVKQGTGYEMWYCYRSIVDYRKNCSQSYRLGYATSSDGLSWTRRDDEVDLPVSNEGWDAGMIAYPALAGRHLFYNGTGFGATGLGLATRA